MAYLTRRNPVREMFEMREMMDRLLDSAFEEQGGRQLTTWGMPLDVVESKDEFVVQASIPGINPDELEITFTEHTLTLKGEVKSDQTIEESRYHLRERRYGRFERSIHLPTEVDADQIEASYEAGVLTLRLPKSEEVKPRRITIQSNDKQKMLEGHFEKAK